MAFYASGKTVPELNEALSAVAEELLLIYGKEAGLQKIKVENIRSAITAATDEKLEAEISRATSAESANAMAISAETDRAKAAEKANADAIIAEATRANAVESILATNLNNEVTRATAAEKDITDSLTLKSSDLWYSSFTSGVRFFHYAGKDVTEYNIPTRNCFIIVMRASMSNDVNTGTALAIQRSGNDISTPTNLWVNRLTGEMTDPTQWAGWTKIANDSTGTDSVSGLTKLYADIGTATDGTMTQAAIASALAALAPNSVSTNSSGYWWNSFTSGVRFFFYGGTDTTEYNLPVGNCSIIVMRGSVNNGTALAIRRSEDSTTDPTEMWINRLTDDTGNQQWAGWTKIALATNLDAEIVRAKGAESVNATAVSTETTRATKAESTLTTNLNAEIARAKEAEASISSVVASSSDYWNNSFTSGVRFFFYGGKDVTEYSLPARNCSVIVMRGGANNGTALAIQRTDDSAGSGTTLAWVNHLSDDTGNQQWSGWTSIATQVLTDKVNAEITRAKAAEAANAADIATINKELDGVADALAAI